MRVSNSLRAFLLESLSQGFPYMRVYIRTPLSLEAAIWVYASTTVPEAEHKYHCGSLERRLIPGECARNLCAGAFVRLPGG